MSLLSNEQLNELNAKIKADRDSLTDDEIRSLIAHYSAHRKNTTGKTAEKKKAKEQKGKDALDGLNI